MASILNTVYNSLIKRNTVFLGTVFFSAFWLEIGFDSASNKIWDSINRGRQWKDIKQKYITKPEGDDDEDDE